MSRHFSNNIRGFTLVEMLVSIAIIGIITSVIIFNQYKYTEAASVTAATDAFATRISEAQIYGVAVKERATGTSDFSAAYGVSVSLLASGSPNSYIIFVDRNANQIYDGDWTCPIGGASECLEKVTFTNGNYFSSLCNIKTNGPVICDQVRRVDITFLRPNLKASLIFFNNGGQQYSPSVIAGEQYAISSPSGLKRYVSIYFSGQISVYNTSL